MLAERGTVFVRGCIGYHFDGLLSQLLVALHPLVLFIAMFIAMIETESRFGLGVRR